MRKSRNRSRQRSQSHEKHQRSRHHQRQRSRSPHNRNRQYDNSQTNKPKKQQQTKTLCIEDINFTIQQIQPQLNQISISIGTSLPDDIEIRQKNIYIRYPGTEVASSVYNQLKGHIYIKSKKKQYKLRYYPFKSANLNIVYDWYCNKCDYKNFARRAKCHRCDNQRNSSCRVNYSSQAMTVNNYPKEESQPNCSLMIRGTVIMQIQQEVLLDLFQAFAPIKDIRMIKNKVTGDNKDFAFVQFFSPEETAFALKAATSPQFRVAGQKVTVMYSRNRQEDDFGKPLPYEQRQRKRSGPGDKKQKKEEEFKNYYQIQRQIQIQQEKQRPLITLQQLKQKHEMANKKNNQPQKQLTEQQAKRKQAEILAKQWEKQMKIQNTVMYICPLCVRKFKNQEEMNNHAKFSQLHLYRMKIIQKNSNMSLII